MQRPALALASLGVAVVSCLAVMYALREPPAPSVRAAPRPAPSGPRGAPDSVARAREAAAPSDVSDDMRSLGELARAFEAQEQAMRDAILRAGEGENLTLDARIERYREAVQAARDDAANADVFDHPGMLTEAFLRMESVQEELAALPPGARSRELANIRRELGYSEEEIARMEQVDERREARWQNGLAYMRERARLDATFEGNALEDELRALRKDHFGHEAPTIEREEDDGFFRFDRPRVYGRN